MNRFTDRLIWVLEKIVTIMITATVVIILLQVFMRYVVSSPLSWTEQVARYLFIWMMMLGIPIMFHRKMYMAFDLVFDSLSPKAQRVLGIIIKATIGVFAIFFFRHSLTLCIKTWGRMTSGIKIPLYCIYLAQPVSAFCIFCVMVSQILAEFKPRPEGGISKC